MRHPWLVLTLLLACNGDKDDPQPTDGDADTDTDTDADADADADADSDADTDPSTASMRLIHLAPTLGGVDVFVDGVAQPVLRNLLPLDGSSWRTLTTGPREIRVAPNGEPPTAAWTPLAVTLADGERYSVLVRGSEPNVVVTGLVDDGTGLDPNQVRYVLWHVAEGLPPFHVVDVFASMSLAQDLDYGDHTAIDVPTGGRRLGVDLDRDGDLELTYDVPDVGAQVSIPLYFVESGGQLLLVGQSPSAFVTIVNPVVVDPGTTTPTGDTGTAPSGGTGATGTTSTGGTGP